MRRLTLILFLAGSAIAQVTYESAAGVGAASNTTATGTITLGSTSTTRAVAVYMSWNLSAVPTGISVTVGGVSAALVAGTTKGTFPASQWYCALTGVLTGSQTVAASWTGAAADENGGAISATGVNQTTPCINGTGATGSAGTVSITITSSSGDLTVSGAADLGAGDTITVSSPGVQSSKVTNNKATYYTAAGVGTGSGTETHKWAGAGSNLYASGFDFLQNTSQATTPTFSPVAGTYGNTQSVTISSSGGVICYNTTGSPATNGTTGCTTGTLYTGAVTVSIAETLYAVGGGTGYTDSAVGSAAYAFTVADPTFSVPAGTYSSGLPVTPTIATTSTAAYLCHAECLGQGCVPVTPAASSPGTCSAGTQVSTDLFALAMTPGYETVKVLGTQSGYTNSNVITAAYNSVPAMSTLNGLIVGYLPGNIRYLNGSLIGGDTGNINSFSGLAIRPPTWGTMDLWIRCDPADTGASPGTALTSAILGNCMKGSLAGQSFASSNFTNNPILMASSQSAMGGTITVGSTTYPIGSATAAMTYDPSIDGKYVVTFTGVSQVSWNGEVTLSLPPFSVSGFSTEFNYGTIYTGSNGSGSGMNHQLWVGSAGPKVATSSGVPGNCAGAPGSNQYFNDFEMSSLPTSGAPVFSSTWRSQCSFDGTYNQTAYNQKYLFSMCRNGTTHQGFLQFYDPLTFRVVYSTSLDFSTEETTPVTLASLSVAQAGHSTAISGYSMTFENYMLDLSGHNSCPNPLH